MHLRSFLQKVLIFWLESGNVHIYHMLHSSLFLSHYFAPVMGDSQYGLLWVRNFLYVAQNTLIT